ncbi:MAG: preprotein translocase subunit SecE [Candidatus Margulisbacteria bacterium]|nr:preprotein translocase subunit SecE [Candidatus Margulisiibacteriota bacterium]
MKSKAVEKSKSSFRGFFSDTKVELKRVSWPDRESVTRASIIIMAIVIASTSFIAVLDMIFSKLFIIFRGV